MNKSDLINAISAFAIVIGLVFVFVELRQSRELAEAELWTQLNGSMLSANLAVIGENAASAIAKSCHEPGALTPTEWEVLVHYRRAMLRRAIDWYRVQQKDLWIELDPDALTRNVALGYLGTPMGRFFWKSEKEWVARSYPRIAEIFNEVLSTIPKGGCLWQDEFGQYIAELSKGEL